ncbi:MAG: MBL fold metallo-hydrolase [Caulobacter sp.]|nr:MBL fold metallo-hydrolase [Caulobacter sp.]
MTMQSQAFFHQPTSTVTYLVWDEASGEAAVIDPVLDYAPASAKITTTSADKVLRAVSDLGLDVRYVLETHAHADHLSAAEHFRKATGAVVVIGEHIGEVQAHFAALFEARDVIPDGSAFGRLVADGDSLELGETRIRVLHTPGHTAACVTYLIDDAAFVGDTLFMPDYGSARTDFPGGDASDLYRSVRRILDLPPETRVLVGHDYLPASRTEFAWDATVAEHRAANIHMHDGVTEAAFVELRQSRDATLAPPALILPSLQVNIRAGALPPASAEGRVFLKLPVVIG